MQYSAQLSGMSVSLLEDGKYVCDIFRLTSILRHIGLIKNDIILCQPDK